MILRKYELRSSFGNVLGIILLWELCCLIIDHRSFQVIFQDHRSLIVAFNWQRLILICVYGLYLLEILDERLHFFRKGKGRWFVGQQVNYLLWLLVFLGRLNWLKLNRVLIIVHRWIVFKLREIYFHRHCILERQWHLGVLNVRWTLRGLAKLWLGDLFLIRIFIYNLRVDWFFYR